MNTVSPVGLPDHSLDDLLLGRSTFCGTVGPDGIYVSPTMTKANLAAFTRDAVRLGWRLERTSELCKARHIGYYRRVAVPPPPTPQLLLL